MDTLSTATPGFLKPSSPHDKVNWAAFKMLLQNEFGIQPLFDAHTDFEIREIWDYQQHYTTLGFK